MNTLKVGQTNWQNTFRGIEQLDTSQLEQILHEVSQMLVRRKVPALAEREAELLLHINQSALSQAEYQIYQTLYAQLQDEKITTDDHQTLLGLLQKMEAQNVTRLASLIELSQIRQVSLDALMKQLGLTSLSAHV